MPGEDGRGLASDMSRARSDIAYGPPRADRDAGASDPRLLCAAAVMRRCLCAVEGVQKARAGAASLAAPAALPVLDPDCMAAVLMSVPTVPGASPAIPPPTRARPTRRPSSPNSSRRKVSVVALFQRSLPGRSPVLNVSPLIFVRNMADADSSLTDTSLSPSASTTHTSLLDSAPGAQRPPDRTSRPDRRASLGLIDAARMRLTVDVSLHHASFPSKCIVPNTCYAPFSSLQFNTLLRSNSRSQPVPPVLSTQVRFIPLPAPILGRLTCALIPLPSRRKIPRTNI